MINVHLADHPQVVRESLGTAGIGFFTGQMHFWRHTESTAESFVSKNKQHMGCEAQLACKCLFTPSFIGLRFGRVK